MTNSLLATQPAVQHMALHLMNINAAKYKWSSETVLMAGKLLHMALLFRKVNLYVSHHFFFVSLTVTYPFAYESSNVRSKVKSICLLIWLCLFWVAFLCCFFLAADFSWGLCSCACFLPRWVCHAKESACTWTRCFTPITAPCHQTLTFPNSTTGQFVSQTFHCIHSSDCSPALPTKCNF